MGFIKNTNIRFINNHNDIIIECINRLYQSIPYEIIIINNNLKSHNLTDADKIIKKHKYNTNLKILNILKKIKHYLLFIEIFANKKNITINHIKIINNKITICY